MISPYRTLNLRAVTFISKYEHDCKETKNNMRLLFYVLNILFQIHVMPTLILLDVSLSMCRPVPGTDNSSEEYQRLNLAIHGINTLLDFCSAKNKQEFISLVSGLVLPQ